MKLTANFLTQLMALSSLSIWEVACRSHVPVHLVSSAFARPMEKVRVQWTRGWRSSIGRDHSGSDSSHAGSSLHLWTWRHTQCHRLMTWRCSDCPWQEDCYCHWPCRCCSRGIMGGLSRWSCSPVPPLLTNTQTHVYNEHLQRSIQSSNC